MTVHYHMEQYKSCMHLLSMGCFLYISLLKYRMLQFIIWACHEVGYFCRSHVSSVSMFHVHIFVHLLFGCTALCWTVRLLECFHSAVLCHAFHKLFLVLFTVLSISLIFHCEVSNWWIRIAFASGLCQVISWILTCYTASTCSVRSQHSY